MQKKTKKTPQKPRGLKIKAMILSPILTGKDANTSNFVVDNVWLDDL